MPTGKYGFIYYSKFTGTRKLNISTTRDEADPVYVFRKIMRDIKRKRTLCIKENLPHDIIFDVDDLSEAHLTAFVHSLLR